MHEGGRPGDDDSTDPSDDSTDPGDDSTDPGDDVGGRDESTDSGRSTVTQGDQPATGSGDPSAESERVSGGKPGSTDRGSAEEASLLSRFRNDRTGALMWVRETLTSVAVVLFVGLILFGVSGVWPPMVAVESGSMEPNMQVGDLVFVTDPGRLAPDVADGAGVVTHELGREAGYRTFGSYGSVIIYNPPGRSASPIIHRAMFHVEADENWYDRADDRYHGATDCESLQHCPAPHDGYITLGDDNGGYDQARGLAPPVKAEWMTGVARLRIPYLGYIRLLATGQVELNEAVERTVGSAVPAG